VKNDVLSAFSDKKILNKRPSKETLNHAGLVYLASGIDPYVNTKDAYIEAYRSLGIDILNRVPKKNVVKTLKIGESMPCGNGYKRAYIGLFDTYFRERYPYKDVDEFFAAEAFDLDYDELITPVPHKLNQKKIREKMDIAGDVGLYYYMFYTTLFMWGVEYLGWEVFMMAATLEPDLFEQKFLRRAFEKSKTYLAELAEADIPYVFVHDDLADKSGPVFSPDWYDKYIFPKYPELWKPIKAKGKKVIFTADGNMEHFLKPLKESGVDGVMLENPSTNFDAILEVFGDGIVICGMDTYLLTFGTPKEISGHVDMISRKTAGIPGFAVCSPGGLHNNISIENLEAYFDARVRNGFTMENWKKGDREYAKFLVKD
jgi:hypothetical protein